MGLVEALHRPLSELVPASPTAVELERLQLLDSEGHLTDEAFEVGCDYTEALFAAGDDPGERWLPSWAWQRAEQVQRSVFGRLLSSATDAEYTAARRFLIERPAGDERELVEQMNAAGSKRLAPYAPIPPDRIYGASSGAWWWACPVCRWPMRINGAGVACAYTHHEARFRLDLSRSARTGAPALVKVSSARVRIPEAHAVEGARCVDLAVWRFITVPGVPELELERRLLRIEGTTVELWPNKDRVDLAVQIPTRHRWEVDVKDHADAMTIVDNAPAAHDIVLPDYRRAQLVILRRAMPDKAVWTINSFVRHVRECVSTGSR
jgi:hypothetical protein